MEKPVTHKFLNSAVFTALLLPLAFFTLRDTIALLTQPLFLSIGGEDSFLYLINDDISRLIMAGLIVLVMPLYFRGKCDFGFRGGLVKLGLLLALPELIVPLWNLLQIKVYDAPLVTGTAAVCAAVVHGIGPGVSEEVLCRSFTVSNLMRIWKDKPHRILRCALVSGGAFGLLHATNVIVTGDPLAALVQVIYTAGLGVLYGAIYLRTRSIWGVMLLHTLTDITAFIAVFDGSATGMDILFCVFGTLLFVALALYLIRPTKRQEIDALWADGWSFGDENGRRHAGAKAAAIVSAVLVAADAVSAAAFQEICRRAQVPTQHYANRPDQAGGATLGNIANTKLPVNTVDIGMAQLAMHSCFETMGSRDVAHFVRAVTACYEAALTFTDTQVTLG